MIAPKMLTFQVGQHGQTHGLVPGPRHKQVAMTRKVSCGGPASNFRMCGGCWDTVLLERGCRNHRRGQGYTVIPIVEHLSRVVQCAMAGRAQTVCMR